MLKNSEKKLSKANYGFRRGESAVHEERSVKVFSSNLSTDVVPRPGPQAVGEDDILVRRRTTMKRALLALGLGVALAATAQAADRRSGQRGSAHDGERRLHARTSREVPRRPPTGLCRRVPCANGRSGRRRRQGRQRESDGTQSQLGRGAVSRAKARTNSTRHHGRQDALRRHQAA